MVHLRLNQTEANPNPHINFIVPLKWDDAAAEEEARQLLRALAAQVRPIMKAEGFVVNSFEEYEHNKVFAGRNWNNGEVIELVLRNGNGDFLPTSWLLSTLCHELAHIKHMNHGPAFQALWTKLRNDVRELQSKGYYGDGYWSSGTRLADSARLGSQGLDAGDLPEYMCGGAQSRARPTSIRRRRRQQAGPSNHTGAQTAKRRKAGSRVTARGTFKGAGRALNEGVSDEEQKKAGAGFRKKAASKRAREERAAAAERRLLALQGQGTSSPAKSEDESDEDDYVGAGETDQDRRRAMLESTDQTELDNLKASKQDVFADFILPPAASTSSSRSPGTGGSRSAITDNTDLGVLELSSDEDDAVIPACDVQSLPKGGTGAAAAGPSNGKQKASASHPGTRPDLSAWLVNAQSAPKQPPSRTEKLSYNALVQDEIRTRKREALGMSGSGRRLGDAPSGSKPRQTDAADVSRQSAEPPPASFDNASASEPSWSCQVCTLMNEPQHLACAACATPRGQQSWSGNPV
ncbi:WLM-domain-containing protein [Trametes polyzona]|nr:WLM-domain-containing protein [Trametes polyzona]